MKCKDCSACKLGWFGSKPFAYVCTGVKEPFVINDINVECTEYKDRRDKKINDLSIEEVIQYWESLLKTFSSKIEKENSYFGRMHLQYTIDVLNVTIDALKTR